ncbi:efflux RND transporter periplasmic adaptor subunit [Terrilactibacillus sp. S3-3]|nr:efflux RND transporter periplasmic adaptor subunit [Terrilactibacillus sp. S3-3]
MTESESKVVDSVSVANDDVVNMGDTLVTFTDGTKLTAPSDGTISSLKVVAGSRVQAEQAILHITDYKHFNTVISVDELDIPKVKKDQKVNITVNAYRYKTYTGTVSKIADEGTVTNGVSSFDVTVHLTKSPSSLKAGMTTTADIITNKKSNVLYVPVDAIHKAGKQNFVYLANPGSANSSSAQGGTMRGQSVIVKTGINNDSNIEIVSGLKAGQTVQLTPITRSSASSGSSNTGGGYGTFRVGSGFGQGMRNGGNGGSFGGVSGQRMSGGNR